MSTKPMSTPAGRGIEIAGSPRDFQETLEYFEALLRARGLTLCAKIDFGGDAKEAGLEMLPTQLLIFGNPKAGTPVMLAAPSSALDLPLKVWIAQDALGKVWLSYNTPEYLAERHVIPGELRRNIAGVRALVESAVAV
jgi:uncharacterized protein (DUF302 family)